MSSHQRWEAVAGTEPFYAILNDPRYRTSSLSETAKQEFFESGARLVDAMFRVIETRFRHDFAPFSILEYGCGVGRLAQPLAKRAARRGGTTVAVDSSPSMLAVAVAEAERAGAANIEFCSPHELLESTKSFDLIVCYLLLQRMPPAVGMPLLDDLLQHLAPGGVAVLHIPYSSRASVPKRVARTLRHHVPFVDTLFRKTTGSSHPFFPTHIYDLRETVDCIQKHSIHTIHIELDPHDDLDTALLYVEMPMSRPIAARRTASHDRDHEGASARIDAEALVASSSPRELNRAAEHYFASIADPEHHLTKPFSSPDEAPALLVDLAVLVDGLQLSPDLVVADLGAGSGWLSRYLTQLGCRTLLVDVSPSALRLAQSLYEQLPIIGQRPVPSFVLFDGERLPFVDGSVDRLASFHAFHHVADPDALLREIARVLRPGGIAGFIEPGPCHSQSPSAQFEMRTFGVLENDIDVHHIHRVASDSGLEQMRLAVFHPPHFHVSLHDFEDVVAGGPSGDAWLASTRTFLRNVRSFFLTKTGAQQPDSRTAQHLDRRIYASRDVHHLSAGTSHVIHVTVVNSGTAQWLPEGAPLGGVRIGAHLYSHDHKLIAFDAYRASIGVTPQSLAPGESAECSLSVGALDRGEYWLEFDCLADQVSWFSLLGSQPIRVRLLVE